MGITRPPIIMLVGVCITGFFLACLFSGKKLTPRPTPIPATPLTPENPYPIPVQPMVPVSPKIRPGNNSRAIQNFIDFAYMAMRSQDLRTLAQTEREQEGREVEFCGKIYMLGEDGDDVFIHPITSDHKISDYTAVLCHCRPSLLSDLQVGQIIVIKAKVYSLTREMVLLKPLSDRDINPND